ncbi:MAG: hypothetical protein ACXWP0_17435, partial [Ktedonobacterales bacterium]
YTNVNVSAATIINDLITNFLASEGVTAGTIATGPTIVKFISAYAPVSACLDAIVSKAGDGWYWLIDQQKRLQFQQRTAAPLAPFVADENTMEMDSIVPTHGNPNYANSVYMLGGTAETATQTETRQGDGKTTAFVWNYPLAHVPTITLNGVAQTVGIGGVDTGKQWYWNAGSNVTPQDNSGTKLTNADTLQNVYVGQFPNVAVSTDGGAVAAQQMREGAGTGTVEAAVIDTTLTSTAQAFQGASGYLSRYAQDLDSIEFITSQFGLAEGQLLTVNVPPDDFNNAQMLIEQIDITDVGPYGGELGIIWYHVKAVSGPINTGWQAFFKHLAAQSSNIIDSISVGQSQTVAILQSGAATWIWTVTGTTQVNSLLIPSATLFPSTTLYPGTAGTPVAITWTKPNVALNAMRDVLSGANTSGLKVGYFAWGTGTQGTPATATKLANEAGRKPITSMPNGASVGESLINGYLGPQDANGVAITEVAFFAGASASGTRDSGTMLLYGLYSHTKTGLESIQVQADSTLS